MKSLQECLTESLNEGLLGYARYKHVNKYKDEFFKIIKPYIKSLHDKTQCPLWDDMLSTVEKTDNLQVILLYDRVTLMHEIENIIPSNTDGHKLVELFDKIEQITNWV